MTEAGDAVAAAIQRHNAAMDAARETARALADDREQASKQLAAVFPSTDAAASPPEQE